MLRGIPLRISGQFFLVLKMVHPKMAICTGKMMRNNWIFGYFIFSDKPIFSFDKSSAFLFLRYHQPRYCRIGCHTVAFWPTRSQWQQLQTTNRWPCRLFWLSTGFKWIQPHTPQGIIRILPGIRWFIIGVIAVVVAIVVIGMKMSGQSS